jgi:hypothetical protein
MPTAIVEVAPAAPGELGLQALQRRDHPERGRAGPPRVIRLVHGSVPERFEGIARVLCEDTVLREYPLRHLGPVEIEEGDDDLGR